MNDSNNKTKRSDAISVIIPVLHEALRINKTIDCLLDLPFEGILEIIVVDGSPDGDTLSAIRNGRIKKIQGVKGRAAQMNNGALQATGGILLFLHADTVLPRTAFQSIASVINRDHFEAGAFDLGIASERFVFRIIERGASFRSRMTRIPYGDQAIFIRKDYFFELGGFMEIPLMEDVELMRSIKRAKKKIFIIPDRVKTSPRRWEKEGIWYCTMRNWTLVTLYCLGVSAEKLKRFYR